MDEIANACSILYGAAWRAAKVARCGNAVCPPMAEAMVRANLPEWCGGKIETMEQLKQIIAC